MTRNDRENPPRPGAIRVKRDLLKYGWEEDRIHPSRLREDKSEPPDWSQPLYVIDV